MRVSLLHNSHSGSKDHTADELVETLRRFAHDVVSVSHSLEELGYALKRDQTELVVVAGGDGTVSRTACALAGSPIPLAILPMGTANNTARALGIHGSNERIVQSWENADRVPFDLANATTNGHTTRFAEAAGWGVFPQVIREAKQAQASDGERSLDAERELFLSVAQRMQPRRYEVTVNGVDCSGDYLLVEISNLSMVGPQLNLTPESSTNDGLLEVTLWGNAERAALCELLESGSFRAHVPSSRHGDRITVRASDATRHVDGHLLELGEAVQQSVHFSVQRAAVHYLVG